MYAMMKKNEGNGEVFGHRPTSLALRRWKKGEDIDGQPEKNGGSEDRGFVYVCELQGTRGMGKGAWVCAGSLCAERTEVCNNWIFFNH